MRIGPAKLQDVQLWQFGALGRAAISDLTYFTAMGIALIIILFMVCSVAAVTYLVRLACSIFSTRVADEMRRHPVIHRIWGGFALLAGPLVIFLWNSSVWIPPSIERREQRRKVVERVEAAGGWDAIRRDCMAFADQHTNAFYSPWEYTNLPPAILALKPLTVRSNPHFGGVRIWIFGTHSTGGHSTPYFGLEVVTRKADGYKPGEGHGSGVVGNRRTFKEVADGVYEVY